MKCRILEFCTKPGNSIDLLPDRELDIRVFQGKLLKVGSSAVTELELSNNNKARKLDWLEAGRGIAAFVVLLSHCYALDAPPAWLLTITVWGKLGVAFFFILSGFIMCHAHSQDLNVPSRVPYFLYRRWLRIFPTYWLVLLFAIAVRQLLGNSDYRIDIDAGFFLNQFFLITPTPFLDVAWTLRHEIVFYAFFTVAIFNVRLGSLILALWLLSILYSAAWDMPCGLITAGTVRCEVIKGVSAPLLFSHLNLYFFAGMAVWIARSKNLLMETTLVLNSLGGCAFYR